MKYTTKPFNIEAVQYIGSGIFHEIKAEFPDCRIIFDDAPEGLPPHAEVYDYLQDTWVQVNEGDYIIRGMKGEYYPCEAEVFEAKYEPAL